MNRSASEDLLLALRHLQSAIDLLDQGDAPAHIAANVDLARHQLADTMSRQAMNSAAAFSRRKR